MRWNQLDEEACSLARTVSVIGDRWTMLILRDCFLRVRRFEDFQERLGIGRGILAERLKNLVEAFVLTKVAYQENPTRYEYRLTPKGLDLHPVIMAMVHWGDMHMVDRKGRPALHIHQGCNCQFDPVMTCSECHAPVAARDVQVLPGPGAAKVSRSPYVLGVPQAHAPRARTAKPPATASRARKAGGA
jgi:DNA-binding HxlR family transcriptional regulator